MNYVYPRFSAHSVFGMRIGGAGLGNLLFMYARAFHFARVHDCRMIWPLWKSIKLGPWLRHEKDKRFYGDLFRNNSGYIDGSERRRLLRRSRLVREEAFDSAADGQVVVFDRYIMDFSYFADSRDALRDDLIRNLQEKNRRALCFDFGDAIGVHIRLGDFTPADLRSLASGANNMSIPVSWYADVIRRVRALTGEGRPAYVFSDGSDEALREVLALPNVERITFGTSIADILALSRTKLLIASGSTFSSWARFLGGMTAIGYKNQLKCHGLCAAGNAELEILSPDEIQQGLIVVEQGD